MKKYRVGQLVIIDSKYPYVWYPDRDRSKINPIKPNIDPALAVIHSITKSGIYLGVFELYKNSSYLWCDDMIIPEDKIICEVPYGSVVHIKASGRTPEADAIYTSEARLMNLENTKIIDLKQLINDGHTCIRILAIDVKYNNVSSNDSMIDDIYDCLGE